LETLLYTELVEISPYTPILLLYYSFQYYPLSCACLSRGIFYSGSQTKR